MNKLMRQERARIFYQMWEENKNRLDMVVLAQIVNTPLKTLYRILMEEQKVADKKEENNV